MSSIEWGLSAANRYVEEERIKSEQWARAINRHQMIVSQAPGFWEKVREALHTQVCSFNEHVGKQVMIAPANGNGKLAIYARTDSGPRTITAEFDSDTPSVRYNIRSEQGTVAFDARYPIDLHSQGSKPVALAGKTECDAEEVASHILSKLMGWS